MALIILILEEIKSPDLESIHYAMLFQNLVFLDIQLGSHVNGGFEILEGLEIKNKMNIIFTTASKLPDHLLKAINEYGANKYIVKPVVIDEVIEAVAQIDIENKKSYTSQQSELIQTLLSKMKSEKSFDKIAINVRPGVKYINKNGVILLKAERNSAEFFLTDSSRFLSSKGLKYYEQYLPKNIFIRVSKSYIINVKHILSYSPVFGGIITLFHDHQVPLSEKYKKEFFRLTGND